MNPIRRGLFVGAAIFALVATGTSWWRQHETFRYLPADSADFVAQFAAPPAPDSTQTRGELAELLALQRARTPAQVRAARADRKKEIERFYGALGLDEKNAPPLPNLHELAENAERDLGPYVRAAKEKFRRLRPYEIEPALEPCIGAVKGDQSYPSGHASYGYVMAEVLTELVPERQASLEKRADDFALQRMICGVHFRSDIEAGRAGARLLVATMRASPEYRRDSGAAAAELRAALGLPVSR